MHSDWPRRKTILLILAIILSIAYIYLPVHGFDFVWDDKLLIVNDHRLQSGVLSWDVISHPVLENTTYFRPLVFLTYFYEVKLFGLDPKIFHLVNLAIFLGNVLLAYLLSSEILGRLGCKKWAWLVCLLYGLHPALVESNAWISGRFDLLASTFVFASLLLFFKRAKPGLMSDVAIVVLMFAGLLSKEVAIVTPGLMFLYVLAVGSEGKIVENIREFIKDDARLILLMGLMIAFYFYLRIISVGSVYHFESAMEANDGRSVLLPLHTLVFYSHQMLLPFFDINPQHDVGLEMLKGYQNPVSHGLALVFVVCLVILAFKNKAAGWLGLAAIFSLSLVLNIIPMTIGGNIGHERFLATPLLFFCIFFVYAGNNIYMLLPPRPVRKIGVGLIVGMFVAGSFFTTKSVIPIWRSNYTLWSWMYQRTPGVDYVSTAYFLTLLNDKRMDEFELGFEEILKSGVEMTPMQKVFYSTYLLEKKDPSSTRYIDAAISAIKNEWGHKNNVLASQTVSSDMLYPLHFDKALSLATLDGDVKGALAASLEAEQWRPTTASPDYDGLWSRLAYYYLLKNDDEVKNLYAKIKDVAILGGKDLRHSYLGVVYQYCIKFDLKDAAACENRALQSLQEISRY